MSAELCRLTQELPITAFFVVPKLSAYTYNWVSFEVPFHLFKLSAFALLSAELATQAEEISSTD